MFRFFLIGLVLLGSGCAKGHGKPIAALHYDSISAQADARFYDLRFRSDVDLLNLFGPGEAFVGGMMYCVLDDDVDFSVGHFMKTLASGFVERDTRHEGGDGFAFVAALSFNETLDEGTTTRALGDEAIRSLVANKGSIPCQYVATVYGAKPYHSGAFQIPTADILRELDK